MRQRIILQFLVFVLGVLPLTGLCSDYVVNEISLLSINSAITPASYDYLNQHFKALPKTSLIVLKMNTPGGLVTTTKDIITMFGREKRPVVVWITPEGASASSAGAIIASASHFLFMSPGSNIGAATPVGLGEDIKEGDGRQKAMNDLAALVRSLSTSRGRPSLPFEKMITEAESYTDAEAIKLGIINGVISNEQDLITYLDGKTLSLDGEVKTLKLSHNLQFKEYEATMGQKLLEVLANPSTAYFLFLIGVALIYFELQAPGGYVSGAFGVAFIILAAIAFQVLPLDWGSMGLIVLGIALLILEVFITSYGLLSVAGLAAFVVGSLFLFHGDSGYISVEYPVLLSTLAGVATAIGLIVWYLWNDKKKQKSPGDFFLPTGAKGFVLTRLSGDQYQVKVLGEIWNAEAQENIEIGDQVEVTSVDPKQLLIKIKKTSHS
ncbi:NfeD family protein [Peredibacter sp. HCB2-198]|uniref:NfeD family protein n=1 Tax=Peredibacter sp. HCB2-198 TaxID=3383025 RepID=UPI0038B63DD1